jgi:hypothetical protein
MARRRRAVGAIALIAATVGAAYLGRDAAAAEGQSQLLSFRVLRSDAIVFATVSSLRQVPDQPGLVEAQLTSVVPVRSRWDLKAAPLDRIRLSGRIDAPDGQPRQVAAGLAGELKEGARYVMLLSGGSWEGAGPFTRGGPSILEIRPDGRVACGSGLLYGLDQRGFICGHAEDFAGTPVTETDLRTDLQRLTTFAAHARPALERELVRTVRPLRLER